MSTETENTAPVAPPVETEQPVEAPPAEAAPVAMPAAKNSNESYGEAFPALGGGAPVPGKEVVWGGANQRIKRIKPTATTISLKIPLEERRFRPGQMEVIGKGTSCEREKTECQKIMAETKTTIEYSQRRDGSIDVFISGKQTSIAEAKKNLLANLTQQGSIDVSIPRQHHRFVLGKGGEKLKLIQETTGAKIQVPKQEDANDLIRVTGSKEAMQAAAKRIQQISTEQAGRHREVIEAEAWLHPFIRGGHDAKVDEMKAKHGIVAIDIPPPSSGKTEVVVRGPADGAIACANELRVFVAHKQKTIQTITINVDRKQHRFVVGNKGKNIQDVLAATGVAVEVPPADATSDTITLRGEQANMGQAITLVFANASSHLDAKLECPEWMHRLLIGQKGATIKEISEKFGDGKVRVDFDGDKIDMEGPPTELESVKSELIRRIDDIKATTAHSELTVPSQYHSHLIGKAGSNLNKLKEEHGVQVKVPQEKDKSNVITIEGPPAGVEAAKAQLSLLAAKIADEATDYIFLNRRFHRQLIGTGGENVRKLRDEFPNVQISIPGGDEKSDKITLRGPTKELASAVTKVTQIARDLEERGYRLEVPILKQYHRNIIGKAGSQINKIRDETNCQIELPKENSDSEIIAIIGRKADVERASKMIKAIEKELVSIVEEVVKIEVKLHQALIGAGGKRVKELQGDDAIIHFPSDGKSESVTIRGKESGVEQAKKALMDEAAALRLQSFNATVTALPEYHKFLIGRNGANMKEIRDKTGCRIAVPASNDEKQDIITIIGTRTGVDQAKGMLETMVKELASIEEKEVTVPDKYHKDFTQRRAELINKISGDCGGVQISFPRAPKEGEEVSDIVKVKGPGNCVDEAIVMIKEYVNDLVSRVTEEVEIEKQYHGEIIGKGGKQVQELQNEFNVSIKFPAKDTTDDRVNFITITGNKEKVDEARDAIVALIPVTFEYPLDAIFHSDLIGQKGAGLQELTKEYNITIKVPQKAAEGEEAKNSITLMGKADLVEKVKAQLDEKRTVWEANAEDRKLRNFTDTIEIEPIFHSKIIGVKGDTINKLREDIDARVNFPKDKNDAKISITGYQDKVEEMKEAIMNIVKDLESHVVQDVLVAQKVHPRIIGVRGSGVRSLMKRFAVEIKFARSPAQPDKVSVKGPADKVDECIDELLNLEEEYLQELADRDEDDRYIPPTSRQNQKQGGKGGKGQPKTQKGYQVSNAPWSLDSQNDYPTLGGQNDGGANANAGSPWGPRK